MWDDARQLNAAAATLAAMALCALVYAAGAWLVRQPMFAFHQVVVVTPLDRVNAAWLEGILRADLRGTFFTLDLDRARAALARVPWVRSAGLRREWPHRLAVEIEEHAPLARWNDRALVDTRGEVFAASYDGELPQFHGPDGSAAEVAARYREWSALLAPVSLHVRELTLTDRGSWALRADTPAGPLAIELGRDEPAERLARLVAAYPRTLEPLARAGKPVARVDLRYRNGFAARLADTGARRTRTRERESG
jgi:cell division protein FtsQ